LILRLPAPEAAAIVLSLQRKTEQARRNGRTLDEPLAGLLALLQSGLRGRQLRAATGSDGSAAGTSTRREIAELPTGSGFAASLSVEEVATLLDVSPSFVRRQARRMAWLAEKDREGRWRFARSTVDELLEVRR
jgi:excisionase family DNA binding protein